MNYFDPIEDKDVFYCSMPANQIQYEKALIKLVDALNIFEEEIKIDFVDFKIEKSLTIYCEKLALGYLVKESYLLIFPGFDILKFSSKIRIIFETIMDKERMRYY